MSTGGVYMCKFHRIPEVTLLWENSKPLLSSECSLCRAQMAAYVVAQFSRVRGRVRTFKCLMTEWSPATRVLCSYKNMNTFVVLEQSIKCRNSDLILPLFLTIKESR
jgi:hypothetical protein